MNGRRKTIVIAALGAVIVAAVAVAIIWTALTRTGDPRPTETDTPAPTDTGTGGPDETNGPSPSPSPDGGEDELTARAKANGWVLEPVTTDPAEYAEAAFRAITTFDTTKSTREEYLAYLETWMTPAPNDPGDVTQDNKDLLSNHVLLPADQWASLAEMRSTVEGDFLEGPTETDRWSDIANVGFEVVMDVTVRPAAGTEDPWLEQRRFLIRVECSDRTVVNEAIGQSPGDCKVIRWVDGD